MKITAGCTYWTVEWTLRIDSIGRRYKTVAPVWVEHNLKETEALWESMGFAKVSDRSWANGDVSTVVTRQHDMEIEYEIHPAGHPPAQKEKS